IGGGGVKTILHHVNEARAQIDRELVEQVINTMELKALIKLACTIVQLCGAHEPVLVQGLQVVKADGTPCRVKVGEIAQQIFKGVAHLTVVLRHLLHQIFGNRHVFLKVNGSNPETDDLS